MPTLVVDPERPDPTSIARAAKLLREGQLVAFPTETVYGLGAHALDAEAVRRIFLAKGRPAYNPLIVHVADVEGARRVVSAWPDSAERAAQAFWPGPLTLVLPKMPEVPDEVTAGLDTVAVRVPSHPVALALLRAARIPVAAPSANRFTELSPTSARHVEKALGAQVALVLDGGPTTIGIESTVVDLSTDRPTLLRPGLLDEDRLARVLGPLVRPEHLAGGETPRPSPGMIERHYAPRARLLLVDAGDRDSMRRSMEEVRSAASRGERTGALLRSALDVGAVQLVAMPSDAADYARTLYGALHAMDDSGCSLVVVEQVPDSAEWAGVRDRLSRASKS
jgi:L-threonylcarbamoyladenylate synthase